MLAPPNSQINISGSPAGSSISSGRRHRRLSSLNTVSWPNPNELTVSPRPRRMSTVPSSDPLEEPNVIRLKTISISVVVLKFSIFPYG